METNTDLFTTTVEDFFTHIFGSENVTFKIHRSSVGVTHKAFQDTLMIHEAGKGFDWSWGIPHGKLNSKEDLNWVLVNAAERLTVAVAKNKTGVGD